MHYFVVTMETKVVYQTCFDKIQFVCDFVMMVGYISLRSVWISSKIF